MIKDSTLSRIVSFLTISSTFNSLFKVLFIFPSRYLYAIGLSLNIQLQMKFTTQLGLQSQTARLDGMFTLKPNHTDQSYTGLSPSMKPLSSGLELEHSCEKTNHEATIQYSVTHIDFNFELGPCSLAVTEGILVSFFSSAQLYA